MRGSGSPRNPLRMGVLLAPHPARAFALAALSPQSGGEREQTEFAACADSTPTDTALHRRQLRGDRRGRPVGGEAEVGEDHLRGVVGGKASDVAAGMAACAAEIKPR